MIVLIVSEEVALARRLEHGCRTALESPRTVVRVAPGLGGTATWADETLVDLLLLDLNLQGPDGTDLLARSVAGPFHTVVISANVEHAPRAFEFGVLDFVPKPVVLERLTQSLHRATDPNAKAGVAAKFLVVRTGGGVKRVPVSDVYFVRSRGFSTELGLADGRSEPHDKPLARLEAILPPVFERVNDDCLVRLSAVREWRAAESGDGEVELQNGVRLFLSAACHTDLREKLCGETVAR